MRAARRAVATFVLAGWPALAAGHPPYELPAGTLTDPAGRTVYLVRAYTDGIVFPDPVTLVVRDATGRTLAQTPERDDIVFLRTGANEILVFGYDVRSSVLVPTEVWRLAGPELTRVDSRWLTLAGIPLHVASHWLGYLVALAAMLTPLAVIQRALTLRSAQAQGWLLAATSIAAIPFVLLCWFVVVMSNLSPSLLLVLAASVALASWRLTPLEGAELRADESPL